jgi:hypothetical protein
MNGGDPVPDSDLERARDLALRYRCKFINLHDFKFPSELLRKVPVTLMSRYNFVPLAENARRTDCHRCRRPEPIDVV